MLQTVLRTNFGATKVDKMYIGIACRIDFNKTTQLERFRQWKVQDASLLLIEEMRYSTRFFLGHCQ